MDEVQEIRQNAQAFRKQKRYSEAVGLYQALWIEHGEVAAFGGTQEVVARYRQALTETTSQIP